jgi:hypothetical protein
MMAQLLPGGEGATQIPCFLISFDRGHDHRLQRSFSLVRDAQLVSPVPDHNSQVS